MICRLVGELLMSRCCIFLCFFFSSRRRHTRCALVTGVQTCALPIYWNETDRTITFKGGWIMEFTSYKDEQSAKQGKRQYAFFNEGNGIKDYQIGRASCRERVCQYV